MYVLLIDIELEDYETLIAALNSQTQYILYTPSNDTYDSIITKIDNLVNKDQIISIALATHGVSPSSNFSLLSNESTSTLDNIEIADPTMTTWTDFIAFLNSIKTKLTNLQHFDFLGCSLLSYGEWRYALNQLETITGINIRASDDDTGNLKEGGDWVLESDNVNVRNVYFTDTIEEYAYLLFGAGYHFEF